MHRPLYRLSAFLAVPFLGACAAEGPVVPERVSSPAGPLVVAPALADKIGVPESDPEGVSFTPEGRLEYVFRLQNRTAETLSVRVRATFFDESSTVTEEQPGQTYAIAAHYVKTFTVTATDRRAKRVQVHVAPAT